MTRIFKYYNFDLGGAATRAKNIAMSSYPGCITSTDNFYVMDSGLTVLDTTLEILNPTVYNRIPEFPANAKIPTWLHSMIANRMAQTAVHWATIFSERNAGIGNSQWLVVDYNLFTPEHDIPSNTLWIVEQMPGLIQKEDRTPALSEGNKAVASYNRPYFKEVRLRTGHEDA